MSKTKKEEVLNGDTVDETQQAEQQQTAEKGAPAFVDELLKNGTAILTAKSREELSEMLTDIPADVKTVSGAVGYNSVTRLYSLRIDIVK